MSDHYVKVKVQLEQMKSSGEGVEKEEADMIEDEVLVASPPASVSPIPASCTPAAQREPPKTTVTCRNQSKSRSKLGKDEKNTGTKQDSVPALQGTIVASNANSGKPVNRKDNEQQTLQIKGTGKMLQGKTETNGNAVPIHLPEDIKVGPHNKEDANKVAKRRKPVTVDTFKAKTSLEALKLSIRQLKWKEFPVGRRSACDIYWHGVSFHDNDNIISGQVNKFPGMIEMLRKINLTRAVRTMQELFPEEYNFYPRSWILPEEYQLFSTQISLAKDGDVSQKPTFIIKPDGGSQGDGIYLIRDPGDLRVIAGSHTKQSVVQEYIHKPLLIDKLKFDIRLYVLVKSLEPLEIYIAKEGLSRFCTEPYQEPSQKNLSHVFMHLTNYSLNVQSGNFVHSDSLSSGSKRTFSSVLYRLASKGVDIKKVWSDIISLVIKTIIALVPELKVYYQADIPPGKPGPTCFQILGFDILLMKNLKPVLLEVNANPSMRIEHEQEVSPGVFEYVPSPVDEEVKVGVIRDTLRLMDPAQKKSLTSYPEHQQEELLGSPVRGAGEEGRVLPSMCLKQVFPKYTKQFSYLRTVERITALFLRFLGVKGNMRLGPTGFRTFIRNCKLSNSHFSMATVDILYIDVTRRWASMLPGSREAGMGLQAFVEAFFYLAQRRFKSLPLREQVVSLLEVCEAQLENQGRGDPGGALPEDSTSSTRRSVSCGRTQPGRTVHPHHMSTSTPGQALSAPQLCSPSTPRRASSQDYRLHQRLRPTHKGNVEN
ncbi:tubulin polyglutamylase TTLL11 isoform X1 [Oncorhynchus mykiss]|uniref:Tubulin tyrosine ligase-like family, member 11 n=3 Tax=Oncorhynchus mykiss TaxID=8022 RepID=A0A8C7UH05_ONCMY|nr:tubulin polyglutamylase TTLL11 isoform X1 [Oncorhynchus mykiss]